MAVNSDEFQIIVFGNVAKPDTFTIKGNALLPTDNVKLLGLHIDNKLKFHHHVGLTNLSKSWLISASSKSTKSSPK